VRAKLAKRPEDWSWSSAAAHISGEADQWTTLPPFLGEGESWRQLLRRGMTEEEERALRRCT
jgi:hypothetical protein